MEKKTIGKFISALRRANGMTQKELGEKLYVSDKTVSRWERDECTPDLYLIPAIAEIFGITSDELLRGERANAKEEDGEAKQNIKSDKQFQLMLYKHRKKYRNLTFISVGATFLALILAAVCNLVAYKSLLAFLLAIPFVVAGEICQILFAVNLRLPLLETEGSRIKEIKKLNSKTAQVAIYVSFLDLAVLAFLLPLADAPYPEIGLGVDTWTAYGGGFAAIAVFVAYMVYAFFIRGLLEKKEILFFDETQKAKIRRNGKLLKTLGIIGGSIALFFGAIAFGLNESGVSPFIKKEVFDNAADFQNYMLETCGADSPVVLLKDEHDVVICNYHYDLRLIYRVEMEKGDIVVVTDRAYYDGWDVYDTLLSGAYILLVADLAVCVIVYIVKANLPLKK